MLAACTSDISEYSWDWLDRGDYLNAFFFFLTTRRAHSCCVLRAPPCLRLSPWRSDPWHTIHPSECLQALATQKGDLRRGRAGLTPLPSTTSVHPGLSCRRRNPRLHTGKPRFWSGWVNPAVFLPGWQCWPRWSMCDSVREDGHNPLTPSTHGGSCSSLGGRPGARR